jgi:hypothetical protein
VPCLAANRRHDMRQVEGTGTLEKPRVTKLTQLGWVI